MTTVVGLAVAIPAVIAYNHFAGKLALFTGELEGFAAEFIGTLAGKAGYDRSGVGSGRRAGFRCGPRST